MLTEKLNECVQYVMQNPKIKNLIIKREKHRNIRIKTIQSTILKRESSSDYFAMLVRIAFDFEEYKKSNIQEDILVDVIYKRDLKIKEDFFAISGYVSTFEVLDLDS